MSSLAPYDDARSLLLAAHLIDPSLIHFANSPFVEPQPPTTWLAFDASAPNVSMLDIGGNVYEEDGTIRILCCTPALSGTDNLRTLAKNVCNVYRGLGPRNPWYLSASITELSSTDDSMWYAMLVSIDYKYQDITT